MQHESLASMIISEHVFLRIFTRRRTLHRLIYINSILIAELDYELPFSYCSMLGYYLV